MVNSPRAGSFAEAASPRRGWAINGDENSPAAPAAPSAAAPRIKRRLQSSHMTPSLERPARGRSLSLAADTPLMLPPCPRAAPLIGEVTADGADAAARNRTSRRSCYTLIRERRAASKRAPAKRSGWRGEGLSLLHDIGDEDDALGVARLATRMGRFGRDVEAIAFLEHTGRLTLYRKLEAAFQHIGGFDSRMRVSRHGHARLYGRFHE